MKIQEKIDLLKKNIGKKMEIQVFLSDDPKFMVWKNHTKRALNSIYGNGSNEVQSFDELYFSPMSFKIVRSVRDKQANMIRRIEVCKKSIETAMGYINLYIEELEEKKLLENNLLVEPPKIEFDKTKVFIVHGHDNLAKTEVENLLRQLDVEPIILHKQANSGNTIIEKINEYTNVGFGIVLYTPCDVGSTKGNKNELKFRARQNVVFEHGFLIGKIGRENVCALKKEEVETPGDISGVVYVTMDPHEGWKLSLVKELESAGYNIDRNKL
jgi:predicted nucleotide-binding protein